MLSFKPRTIFFVAILGGTLGIIIGYATREILVAPILALFVMALYGVWVTRQSAAGESIEQLADSFYYLGFILTLMALIVALIAGRTTNILSIFGTGLITTAVGLAGKLFFSQFQNVGSHAVDVAEQQLAHNITQLAISVNETNRYLNDVRTKASTEITKVVSELAQRWDTCFRSMSQAVTVSIDELSRKTAETLAQNEQRLTESYRVLGNTVPGIQNELSAFHDIVKKLNSYTQRHVETINTFASSATDSFKQLEEAAGSTRVVLTHLKELDAELGQFHKTYQELQKDLQAVTEVIRLHGTNTRALSNEMSNELREIMTRKNLLEQEVQEAQALIQQVHRNLIDCSNFIITRLSTENSNEPKSSS